MENNHNTEKNLGAEQSGPKENQVVNEQEQNRPVNSGNQPFQESQLTPDDAADNSSPANRNQEDKNEDGDDNLSESEMETPAEKEEDSVRTEKNIPNL